MSSHSLTLVRRLVGPLKSWIYPIILALLASALMIGLAKTFVVDGDVPRWLTTLYLFAALTGFVTMVDLVLKALALLGLIALNAYRTR